MARKIILKTEKIIINKKPVDFNYGDTIKTVLSQPGPNGFGMEDIRQSVKIIDRLGLEESPTKETLTLEESEWMYLKKKIETFRWGFQDNAIVDFDNAINNTEEIGL